MLKKLKKVAGHALDALLPPLCLTCDEVVGGNATLCPACWQKIRFIDAPYCACCGVPFDVPVGAGTLCGRCIENAPVYGAARSALLYDDFSRRMILAFKHGDKTHIARAFATWMVRAGGEVLAQADAIVPVPLHRWRLFMRRYNQAALLAQAIGKQAGKEVWPDALIRARATPSQGHRKKKERAENVHGAFRAAKGYSFKGKRLLLIDDVLTTGATVEECTKILRAAGAARVDVLTLARVPFED